MPCQRSGKLSVRIIEGHVYPSKNITPFPSLETTTLTHFYYQAAENKPVSMRV
jgi:hypothetical protein